MINYTDGQMDKIRTLLRQKNTTSTSLQPPLMSGRMADVFEAVAEHKLQGIHRIDLRLFLGLDVLDLDFKLTVHKLFLKQQMKNSGCTFGLVDQKRSDDDESIHDENTLKD